MKSILLNASAAAVFALAFVTTTAECTALPPPTRSNDLESTHVGNDLSNATRQLSGPHGTRTLQVHCRDEVRLCMLNMSSVSCLAIIVNSH